jgi:hypothetical protein
MNTKLIKTYGAILTAAALLAIGSGCSLNKDSGAVTTAQALANTTMTNVSIPGTGSTYVPTAVAVQGRLMKALSAGGVTTQTTNCKKALAQVASNLATTSNPIQAAGLGQVMLAAAGCCEDVKSGSYGVTFGNSITSAATQTSLVNACLTLLNSHTGGLATGDPSSAAAAAAACQQLVTADAAISGETTQNAFVSVCMAANSYGITMTGF